MSYTVNNMGNIGTGGFTFTTPSTAQPMYTTGTGITNDSWATISADPNLQGRTLSVKGNAEISGELTVQGVKLSDRLDKIEERLGILRPNEKLEAKWEKLRALRNAYKELEAEIIEKEEIWKILKK